MSSDTNGDGKVSYRDLFERMMSRIPQEWLAWIYENVNRGVSDKTIVKILLDNGFKQEIAQQLLERTKREGLLTVERTYADNNFGYIYQVRA
jgi:propanediol dehydratase large subunit